MLYEEYLELKAKKDRLAQRFAQQQAIQNQTIRIQELILVPPFGQYGETEKKRASKLVRRLIAQMKFMAGIANLHHQKNYCEPQADGSYQLKKEALNTITRLSTAEFSFYGKRPLNEWEFEKIHQAIKQIGESCHPNVHVLFSTFSLLGSNNQIFNVAFYLQGGSSTQVDVLVKTFSHPSDVEYDKRSNFSQYHNTSSSDSPPTSAEWTVGMQPGISVCNNNLLRIKTAGGGEALLGIDICFDHQVRHAKQNLLKQFNEPSSDNFLPVNVDQIVTSNTADPEIDSLISKNPVLYADPNAAHGKLENAGKLITTHSLTIDDLQQVLPGIKVRQKSKNPLIKVIDNPPFGAKLYLLVYTLRKLNSYAPLIAYQFFKTNQVILNKKIAHILSSNNHHYDQRFETCVDNMNLHQIQQGYSLIQGLINQLQFYDPNGGLNREVKRKIIALCKKHKQKLESIISSLNKDQNNFLIQAKSWAKELHEELTANFAALAISTTLSKKINEFAQSIEVDLSTPLVNNSL